MRKNIFILSLLLTSSFCIAQNWFPPTNGNVGIGTIEPAFKLDVNGGGRFKIDDDQSGIGGLTIETNNGTNLKIGGNTTYSWIQSHAALPLYINELGNNTIFNRRDGNVGIGTTNPLAKLDVNGEVKVKENLFITGASGGYTTGDNPILFFGVSNGFARINIPFGDKMILSSYHGYAFKTSYNGATPITALTIGITGDVGIGVTNPDEKLTVKGKIHAQEVRIDLAAPIVPDYVFANDYKLRSLEEVEDYVKENRHLPEIPSAAVIEKNGLMLAEMNMSLLKKIEELTLYAIEQKKELSTQKEEIIQLKKYNTELELIKERLLKLEDK